MQVSSPSVCASTNQYTRNRKAYRITEFRPDFIVLAHGKNNHSGKQSADVREDAKSVVEIHVVWMILGLTCGCGLEAFSLKGLPGHVPMHVLPQALQAPHHVKLTVREVFQEAVRH